jgi:glycosyltransferase involved in cell wall biosynthesis
MRRRIVILTGNHVCHNPRAFKEAETLAADGFDVEWLGAWFDAELTRRDRLLLRNRKWQFTAVSDWSSGNYRSRVRRQRQRLRRWIGMKLHKLLGWGNSWQLGYCTRELYRAVLQRDADLFIAHSEPALWVAKKLAQRGHRVGVDMEDWFSEDLLPEARKSRPLKLLHHLENSLLKASKHRTCPSKSMSRALAEAYQCEPPEVIYNAFPWVDRKTLDGRIEDRVNRAVPSIHWFSQTIARGRGLEDLFAALTLLSLDCEIHLRGRISQQDQQWLNEVTPPTWKDRVFVHPVVHNDELLSRIAEHDIGLALDPKEPPSRNLTITNKILQYLLAGLPVIASDTAGHREVAELALNAVFLYRAGDPAALAELLMELLASKELSINVRGGALRAAEQTFCWEQVSPVLLENVKGALMAPPGRAYV